MRKAIVLLVVMGMAIPALATVNFSAADAGAGKLSISYAADAGEQPRGIALTVSLSDGATVDSAADVVAVDAAYNAYIDYAFTQIDLGNPYAVGDGHPLADLAAAGVASLPASDFSICMGVLDQTGNQGAGPGSASPLITLQLHDGGAGTTTATIDVDADRGGVVGSQLATNLPITQVVNVAGGCATCVGDVNGDNLVRVTDLTVLLGLLQQKGVPYIIQPTDPLWNPCADVNGDNLIRVTDITVLLGYLQTAGAPYIIQCDNIWW